MGGEGQDRLKHVSNLIHLVIGVVLLVGGVLAFRLIGEHGKGVWDREKSVVDKPRPRAGSDVDDLMAAASGGKVYGVMASDGAAAITGQTLFVDCGYQIMGM